MPEMLTSLFSRGSLQPHGYCFLWQPEILWLHVVSDAVIALSYYSIPVALFWFSRQRQDLPFKFLFRLFGTFIFLCGTTHLFAIWVLWYADYGIEGMVKAWTAAVSAFTAFWVWRLLPQALKLPSPAQLKILNEQLVASNVRIEQKVLERTAEFEHANARLQVAVAEYEAANQRLEASEHALREALKATETANAAKKEFLARMSHDIRTPMNAIVGLSHILSISEPLTEKQRKCIHTLNESADAMLELLNELFELRYKTKELEPADIQKPPPASDIADFENYRILVVEDWQPNVMVISLLLDAMHVQYQVVGTGEEALEVLQREAFDLALMDIQLPGIDGYEAVKRWRKIEAETGRRAMPIIATTAFVSTHDRQQCLDAGMNDYISKPINSAELRSKISQLLKAN